MDNYRLHFYIFKMRNNSSNMRQKNYNKSVSKKTKENGLYFQKFK